VRDVVGVHPRDDLAVAAEEPAAERARDALAGSRTIATRRSRSARRARIAGSRPWTVVHAHEREVALRLAQDRRGRRPHRPGGVADGHETETRGMAPRRALGGPVRRRAA